MKCISVWFCCIHHHINIYIPQQIMPSLSSVAAKYRCPIVRTSRFLGPERARRSFMAAASTNVYAVASEDMDSLTFGAPKFLRHLMDPSTKKIPVMEFDISKVLEDLELSMDQFIDLCILCGCDYCDSIRGIGPQTALKLVHQHGSMENILENISKERLESFFKPASTSGPVKRKETTETTNKGAANKKSKSGGAKKKK